MTGRHFTVSFTLALGFSMIGCGKQPVQTVHAASPTPTPASTETLCTANVSAPEEFAHGTVQPNKSTVFETADYLQYTSPVCPSSGYTLRSSYTMQFAHHVQMVDMQMGSGMSNSLDKGEPESTQTFDNGTKLQPEVFEWAWWAQFDTPDGHHYEFFQQYDKHSDVQGNQNVKYLCLMA